MSGTHPTSGATNGAPPANPPDAPTDMPADNRRRVMVVDDSYIMRRLVTEIVSSDPDLHVVETAENGKIALQKARGCKPDLILLDIEMPEMSGMETLRRLGLWSRSKVMILSFLASENSPEAIEARRLGAVDVLQKPSGSVSLDINARMGSDLLVRIRRALGLPPLKDPAATDTAPVEVEGSAAIRTLVRAREVLFEVLAEGVIEFNDALQVTAVNSAAQRLLGKPLLGPGTSLVELFSDENLDFGELVRTAATGGRPVKALEIDYLTDAAEFVPLRVAVQPVETLTGGSAGVLLILEDISRERSLMKVLGRTTSRQAAGRALKDGQPDLNGTLVEAGVLFSDIRGFTTLSEVLGPQKMVEVLNEYFSFMEDVISNQRGEVDKYIGDAIMATFGGQGGGDYKSDAVQAARDMIQALALYNQRNPESQRIEIGIGIASGKLISGNIGSPARMNFTMIGDPVNRASRLESLTKSYGTPILICNETHAGIGGRFACREIDKISVKGQAATTTIHEVLTVDPSALPADWMPSYAAGRASFERGDFAEAAEQFATAWRCRVDDKAAALMVERCRRLIEAPPKDWNGVWQYS